MQQFKHMFPLLVIGAALGACSQSGNIEVGGPDVPTKSSDMPVQFSGSSRDYDSDSDSDRPSPRHKKILELASGDGLTDHCQADDPTFCPVDAFDPMNLDLDDPKLGGKSLPINFNGYTERIAFYAKQIEPYKARGYFKYVAKFEGLTLANYSGHVTCIEVVQDPVTGKRNKAFIGGRVTKVQPHDPFFEPFNVFWSVEDNGYGWYDWDDDDRDHDDWNTSKWPRPRDRMSSVFNEILPGGPLDPPIPTVGGCQINEPIWKTDKGNFIVKRYFVYY